MNIFSKGDNKYFKIEIKEYYYNKFKYGIYLIKILVFISIVLLYLLLYNKLFNEFKKEILIYKNYINDCKNHKKKYKYINKISFPYLTIILLSFNMEEYLERALLSILNQTFNFSFCFP